VNETERSTILDGLKEASDWILSEGVSASKEEIEGRVSGGLVLGYDT